MLVAPAKTSCALHRSPCLTVVTNAINIAAQLAMRPKIKIMVTGGILNPRSYELVGPYTDVVMEKVTMDIAFIGVNGVDPKIGPTITDEGEARVNTVMARRATDSYVLADSTQDRQACLRGDGRVRFPPAHHGFGHHGRGQGCI